MGVLGEWVPLYELSGADPLVLRQRKTQLREPLLGVLMGNKQSRQSEIGSTSGPKSGPTRAPPRAQVKIRSTSGPNQVWKELEGYVRLPAEMAL